MGTLPSTFFSPARRDAAHFSPKGSPLALSQLFCPKGSALGSKLSASALRRSRSSEAVGSRNHRGSPLGFCCFDDFAREEGRAWQARDAARGGALRPGPPGCPRRSAAARRRLHLARAHFVHDLWALGSGGGPHHWV